MMRRTLTQTPRRTEHHKRSPDCRFFVLTKQYQQAAAAAAPKKAVRGKAARASKASRLSSQSDTTVTTDMTESIMEAPAEYEDSDLTMASVASQGGTKKPRAKKAAAPKGKKAKAKKEEPAEVPEDQVDEPVEEASPPPAKPARGKKRASDQVEESTLIGAGAPAPKKRGPRSKASKANKAVDESSIATEQDTIMDVEEAAPAQKKKPRASKAKAPRKLSTASTVSDVSSLEVPHESDHMMDDAEIERQLQAELDRPLTDDEDLDADSDSERRRVSNPKPKTTQKKTSTKKDSIASQQSSGEHHAMFDPSPVNIDEEDIEQQYMDMQQDAQPVNQEMLEPSPEIVPAPAKAPKKAAAKKATKQPKKAPTPSPVAAMPENKALIDDRYDDDIDELAEGHEDSMMSNATAASKPSATVAPVAAPAPAPKKRGPAAKKSTTKAAVAEAAARESAQRVESPDMDEFSEPVKPKKVTAAASKKAASAAREKSLPPALAREEVSQIPATPRSKIPATARAKQATISPSQSPQSSDAENQPPSSRPSGTTESKRFELEPVAVTPERMSPSKMSPTKRNLISGLQSEKPWAIVDVEAIFEDLEKENANGTSALLQGGPNLTSPERRMTVEEWIYFNAQQAEQKLKYECESVVSAFEREGARAMQTLEGLVIE